ncbi:uncharacterized protein [Antedon mediterranea]|uniref:uncharacterized protein isoform X1 n=1 Tax=Antedon mediterranea TaxID=105859 RepID=UPI003AF70FB2
MDDTIRLMDWKASESDSIGEYSCSDGVESPVSSVFMSRPYLSKDVNNPKKQVKRSVEHRYKRKTSTYLILIAFIILVVCITVFILEVVLKFDILSMAPKTDDANTEKFSSDTLTTTLNKIAAKQGVPTSSPPITKQVEIVVTSVSLLTNYYTILTGVKHCKGWTCKNGNCIAHEAFCDTVDNCGDNSDERGCDYNTVTQSTPPNIIREKQVVTTAASSLITKLKKHTGAALQCNVMNEYKCKNGNCVSNEVLCDSVDNCGDHSDEYLCDCGDEGTAFICDDNYCVNRVWVCDGHADCFEGEDEHDCPAI